jgi:predicted amidohydrolase
MANKDTSAWPNASSIRVGLCQYRPEHIHCFQAYETKQRLLVAEACANGAEVIVFPEYGSLELTAMQSNTERTDLLGSLDRLQVMHDRFLALWAGLAVEFNVLIVAPSFPVKSGARVTNRAYVCTPSGVGYQEKIMMTRFERERWLISPGVRQQVFVFRGLKLAVAICYDVEFPVIARRFAAAGAELLLVPSCTDTWAGYHRVRTGCLARALENQFIVAQTPLVGYANWSPAIDVSVGRAGIFLPMDSGCPDDGVLSLGAESERWHFQMIDLALIRRVRESGQVLTYRDWPEQFDVAEETEVCWL